MTIGEIATVLGIIAAVISAFFKNRYDNLQTKDSLVIVKTDILELTKKITDHETSSITCSKDFENIHLDIFALKQSEKLKENYQTEIIASILTPILEKMSTTLMEYVDIKLRLTAKEIENIKGENKDSRHELVEMLKDFKNENSRALTEFKTHIENTIDRLLEMKKKL